MTFEEIFATVVDVCTKLLPIFGVLVLLVLFILLIRLIKTFKKLNTSLDGVNEAMDTVNVYLKDLNTTVEAVNNIATSVEAVRFTTEKSIKKTTGGISKGFSKVKGWTTGVLEEIDGKIDQKHAKKQIKHETNKTEEGAVETVKK